MPDYDDLIAKFPVAKQRECELDEHLEKGYFEELKAKCNYKYRHYAVAGWAAVRPDLVKRNSHLSTILLACGYPVFYELGYKCILSNIQPKFMTYFDRQKKENNA
eukprot:878509_1